MQHHNDYIVAVLTKQGDYRFLSHDCDSVSIRRNRAIQISYERARQLACKFKGEFGRIGELNNPQPLVGK